MRSCTYSEALLFFYFYVKVNDLRLLYFRITKIHNGYLNLLGRMRVLRCSSIFYVNVNNLRLLHFPITKIHRGDNREI